MFPDDAELGTANKDVNTIIEMLNDHSANISDWMTANKPSFNRSETEIFFKN